MLNLDLRFELALLQVQVPSELLIRRTLGVCMLAVPPHRLVCSYDAAAAPEPETASDTEQHKERRDHQQLHSLALGACCCLAHRHLSRQSSSRQPLTTTFSTPARTSTRSGSNNTAKHDVDKCCCPPRACAAQRCGQPLLVRNADCACERCDCIERHERADCGNASDCASERHGGDARQKHVHRWL